MMMKYVRMFMIISGALVFGSSPSLALYGGTFNQIGSGAFTTAQASPGTSATSIVAARTGSPGTGRIAAIIINMSTTPVYIGASGVTTSTGSYLAGVIGATIVIPTQAAIYGIVSSGTGSVSVMEIY
jgi:hypothetical protein